ncbi:MAG: GGDEF-domain containing protein [Alphaproteobacteria bacterium]|nr:GGDEF-domain containing protein [Alphaproteobacteria bacterium]
MNDQSKSGRKSLLFKSYVWKSKITWRLAFVTFLTLLFMQVVFIGAYFVKFESYHNAQIFNMLKNEVISSAVMDNMIDGAINPFETKDGDAFKRSPNVLGYRAYDITFEVLDEYGKVTGLNADLFRTAEGYKQVVTGDGYVDVLITAQDLNDLPFYIAFRLDSTEWSKGRLQETTENAGLLLGLSLASTLIILMFIGSWLLVPTLFLSENLRKASLNPEKPEIDDYPYKADDEIGTAVLTVQSLIRQNADNISRIKSAAQDQIHKLAYYDTLTGLPNRILFLQKLAELARSAMNEDGQVRRWAVITIDLDHFKDVNDTMGHNIGDAILRGVGKRLASALPDTAVVARTGEDEYAITVPMVTSITNAKEIGERIQNVIRNEPFKVFNENFQIRCSIGVATYPDDASDPEQVLKNADIALNRAKEDGRDTIREYVEDFDRAVQLRFQMLRDLRDALEEEQLTLHFQPQLDLKTGEVIGAEALLRWWRPDDSEQGGTYISPGLFVPIAEQSGLIVPIGEFVLRNACRTAKTWHDKGHNVRIAVNVSGAQFHQSDVVALTKEVLEETGIPPKYLELEVTESVFMDDVEFTIETLMKLNQIGVELAIDDFGTGYSSLSYLRQFPIDRLKIDQSFIRNALQDEDDAAITKTIISLGHSLNLKVIAEGVEDYEHEEFLLREGCDEVQGYRYSRPVPADQFMEFLETYNGDLEHFKKQA